MAATLQDVSSKLMRPAKDLAEWKFPLAQILEDYYTLLEQPCELNFGEAALVLQNSVNVYVRRVEYLFQETADLNQSINDHKEEENNSTASNQRKYKMKSRIDFENFDFIDFTKHVNKNGNLKPIREEKKIKMLTQRYPQLENISKSKFSFEIVDINGEIIGKKYDFRCNEQLSLSKMLINEVTPNDFSEKQINNKISEILETDLEVGCAFDSCSEYGDTCRDTSVFSPFQESGYGSMISSSDVNTPSSRDLSDFSNTLNDSIRDPKDSLMSSVNSSIECDKNLIAEPERIKILENESENLQSMEKSTGEMKEMNRGADRTSRIRDSIETDAGYTSGDPDDIQQQIPPPAKKIRRITRNSLVNSLNEDVWKPIPFNGSIPDKLPKSRREFKLPCHISLLKYRPKLRKRKSDDSVKRENLKCYLINEGNVEINNRSSDCDRNKNVLCTPTKSISIRGKEEFNELEKQIKRCVKTNLQRNACNYRTVENSNMDLLGYDSILKKYTSNITKKSDTEKNFIEDININTTPVQLPPLLEASCSYTPPQSPTYSIHSDIQDTGDDFLDESTDIDQKEQTHQERIEQKMKLLQQEFDIRNEQEEATKQWYDTIKTLKSVKRRPVFHVHEYEKRILDELEKEKSHRLHFDVIAMKQEPDDIARLFVASLHLANTYNVQINVVESNGNSAVNLTLLNEDLKHHT